MAVGGCFARTGGWSIRPYTVSANACHLKGILSGLTTFRMSILGTFAVSIHGMVRVWDRRTGQLRGNRAYPNIGLRGRGQHSRIARKRAWTDEEIA